MEKTPVFVLKERKVIREIKVTKVTKAIKVKMDMHRKFLKTDIGWFGMRKPENLKKQMLKLLQISM